MRAPTHAVEQHKPAVQLGDQPGHLQVGIRFPVDRDQVAGHVRDGDELA